MVALYLANASWLATAPSGEPTLLAHRGIHQTFSREGLGRDDCTATRIDPPTNPYLENTLASMRASFAAGADILEVDIHPTTDGDSPSSTTGRSTAAPRAAASPATRAWPICARSTSATATPHDGGRTYPFRGRGVGLMPTLAEVLRAFPDRQLLLNIKAATPMSRICWSPIFAPTACRPTGG